MMSRPILNTALFPLHKLSLISVNTLNPSLIPHIQIAIDLSPTLI
jgi:hypothetical protein